LRGGDAVADRPRPTFQNTVESIGAHLAVQLSDERGLELSDQLTRILSDEAPGSGD
jgi:hypothetical protein